MLTAQQIHDLPPGEYRNSQLRRINKKHGTPVKFQDDKGKIHTFISNRWWSRHRKRNPLISSRSKKDNINTEFERVYGKSAKKKNWFENFLNKVKNWFGL